jgi:hypothetical protein
VNSNYETIRQPYGSFDGRFPTGIILNVQSPEQWDILTGIRELSSAEIETFAESDIPHLFKLVSLATTLEHELRHFHDFMLSPLGSSILAERLSIAMNSLQVFGRLVHAPDAINAVPLPLTRWIEMSANEQDRYLSSISQFLASGGVDCQLTGPKLSRDDLMFKVLASAGDSMKRVTSFLTSRFSMSDVITVGLVDVAEASALAVQSHAIRTVFGDSALGAFFAGLKTVPDTTYSRMTNVLVGLSMHESMPWNSLGALTTWSLMGDFDELRPEVRFAAAMTDLIAAGYPENADPTDLFDRWDKRYQTTAITEVMRRSLDKDMDLLDKRKQVAVKSGNLIAVQLAEYYETYCSARRDLVEAFLIDPSQYTDTFHYRESMAKLRQPLIVINGRFERSAKELEAAGFTVMSTRDVDGVTQAQSVALPLNDPAKAVHDVATAQSMLLSFLMADAITSEITNGGDLSSIEMMKRAVGDEYHILRLPV